MVKISKADRANFIILARPFFRTEFAHFKELLFASATQSLDDLMRFLKSVIIAIFDSKLQSSLEPAPAGILCRSGIYAGLCRFHFFIKILPKKCRWNAGEFSPAAGRPPVKFIFSKKCRYFHFFKFCQQKMIKSHLFGGWKLIFQIACWQFFLNVLLKKQEFFENV